SESLPLQLVLRVKGTISPWQPLVAHDVRTGELIQLPVHYFTSIVSIGFGKHPIASTYGMEVLFPNPISGLSRMPAFCPPPESPENNIIQLTEGFFGHYRRVI